uniref:Uncharacterized protein n=1 Tax=Rhizophora mucronata TaxID=61149 RepID=A0A2P2N367_RHIMU
MRILDHIRLTFLKLKTAFVGWTPKN